MKYNAFYVLLGNLICCKIKYLLLNNFLSDQEQKVTPHSRSSSKIPQECCKVLDVRYCIIAYYCMSPQCLTLLSPVLEPLAHHRGGVVAALPRHELLPAPALPPNEPVHLAPGQPQDALLEVVVGAAVAAASLEQVIDGEVVAVNDADVSTARLVSPASWVEINMAQRPL